MRVAIVGTGYVGLITGACLASVGHFVTCQDVDAGKIESLLRGELPIYETDLEPLLQEQREAGRLNFTTDLTEALPDAEVAFICVGTPSQLDGSVDLNSPTGRLWPSDGTWAADTPSSPTRALCPSALLIGWAIS